MTRLHPIPHSRGLRLLALAPFAFAISLVILACGGGASTVQHTPTVQRTTTSTTAPNVAIAPRPGSLTGFDGGNTKDVAFIDTAGNVRVLSYQAATGWQASDLTQTANAPMAQGNALAGFYDPRASTRNIAYTDTTGDIVLLTDSASGAWQATKPGQTAYDEPVGTQQPAPASNGAAITAAFSYNSNVSISGDIDQLLYVGQNGHLIVLYNSSPRTSPFWFWTDLTSVSGAPAPQGTALADCPISKLQGDALFEVVTGGNVVLLTAVYLGRSAQEHQLACLDWQVDASLHVFYLDSAGDLQELYVPHLNQQGVDITQVIYWHASDWSSQVSAPKPAGPFAAFVFTSNPAQPEQVAYIDDNSHVQEFAVDYGVYKVTVSDLTQPTNAPLAAPSQGIVGYEWAAGASQQIVYVDGHNHLQELSFIQGGAWKVTDLTTSASLFQ